MAVANTVPNPSGCVLIRQFCFPRDIVWRCISRLFCLLRPSRGAFLAPRVLILQLVYWRCCQHCGVAHNCCVCSTREKRSVIMRANNGSRQIVAVSSPCCCWSQLCLPRPMMRSSRWVQPLSVLTLLSTTPFLRAGVPGTGSRSEDNDLSSVPSLKGISVIYGV